MVFYQAHDLYVYIHWFDFFLVRLVGLYFTVVIVLLPLESIIRKIFCLYSFSFGVDHLNSISFQSDNVCVLCRKLFINNILNVTGTYRIGCDWKIINNHFSTAKIICFVFNTFFFWKLPKSGIPMGKTNLFPRFRI